MIILIPFILLGGIVAFCAGIVFPYRVRFVKKWHRAAFELVVVTAGLIGAGLFSGGAGIILLSFF